MSSRLNWVKTNHQSTMRRRGWESVGGDGSFLRDVRPFNEAKVRPDMGGWKPVNQPGKNVKKKFFGTFAELKRRVSLVGLPGDWVDRGNLKQFYTAGGGILN
jgi:hypothetical protein